MRAHYKFWPKRLPHAITLPVTSLWDNLAMGVAMGAALGVVLGAIMNGRN